MRADQYYLLKLQHDLGPDEILPRRWKTQRFAYLQPLEVLAHESISDDIEADQVAQPYAEPVRHLHEPSDSAAC